MVVAPIGPYSTIKTIFYRCLLIPFLQFLCVPAVSVYNNTFPNAAK